VKLPDRRIIIPLAGAAVLLGLVAWLMHAAVTFSIDSYASCASAGYPVSGTDPPVCSDGHHSYLGPSAAPAASADPSESVPFEILVTGDSGGAYPRLQETITSEAGWEKYWAQVHAASSPLPPILPVDFRLHDVIALSEGRQMTGGYNLKVTSINRSARGTIIDVTEQIPTITCPVTTSITNRYFMALTDKLTEPVSFRITTDRRQCGP
jgi:hypothetical protein